MPGSTRCAAVAALAVLATGLFASTPVQAAAAPPNDDVANAVAVTATPFTDTVSVLDATEAADDPSCGDIGTVWYTWTPATDGLTSASASPFGGLVGVFTGRPGSFDKVDCSQNVVFQAVAGTTYYIMVTGEPYLTEDVTFTLRPALPPLTSLTLTLDRGTVDRQVGAVTGLVTFYGTVTCDQDGLALVDVQATQRHGHSTAVGEAFTFDVPCSTTPTAWSASMSSITGTPFTPGKVTLDYGAFAENESGSAVVSGHTVLILTGTG